jgi:prefoldin subunit 5
MFTGVVDDCCHTATRLQQALADHDQRALALLRQMQAEQQAADASAAAHAARSALPTT